jgi:excisionase family DNA binding protein
VDAPGGNGAGIKARMTVEEAARSLGIKEESVRKRVRRGKMRSEKESDGRLYVYLDGHQEVREGNRDAAEGMYGYRSRDGLSSDAREVLEAKDETIRVLQHQLEEEREARRRADTIIAQLTGLNVAPTARLPGLGDPSTEPPDTDGEAVATVEGGPMAPERGSSWWRRRSGRE